MYENAGFVFYHDLHVNYWTEKGGPSTNVYLCRKRSILVGLVFTQQISKNIHDGDDGGGSGSLEICLTHRSKKTRADLNMAE